MDATTQPPSFFRLGVAQPRPHLGDDAARNVDWAVDAVRSAATGGAQLVVFPEGYPGPHRITSSYDAEAALARVASEVGCGVYWSRVERVDAGLWQKVGYMLDGHGQRIARYPRTHPATGDVHLVLAGTPIAPGEQLHCVEIAGVKVGLMICSELWLPEVSRVLALRGAEILLAPAGGMLGPLAANWRLIASARAIENQCFVALTQNLYAGEDNGAALVAGPEHLVAEMASEGVFVAELDLGRARWLREHDDSMAEPKQFSSLPGLLRARRPELYSEISEPRTGLYDYHAAAQSIASVARKQVRRQ